METVMRRYLTEQQQRTLLRTISRCAAGPAKRDCAWISLLIATGLRIGEFSKLSVIDARRALATSYLAIPKAIRKGKRADHAVFITRRARTHLRELLLQAARMRGCTINALADDAPLVQTVRGARMSLRGYQDRMRHWAHAAGLPDGVSPHWLRHTRAMEIMRKSTSNDPRGIVQAQLGHASIASTGVYTRISQEELTEQLELIDAGGVRKREVVRALRAA